VKSLGLFLAALFILTAQTSQTASSGASAKRHLVYQFGYNTAVATSGNGTGTTTIDISGPAEDGGLMVSASDHWWNTVRARATNTCELYASGNVKCAQAPNAISPIQLTIFPVLAHSYFAGLNAGATSSWTHKYTLYAAIIPGASGFAGQPTTWDCSFTLHGKGPIKNAGPYVLITGSGSLNQQGGTYLKATSKIRIAYDPAAKVPGIITEQRTHIPYRSVYSNDIVEVKLTQDSGKHH
jgi:hypothetical protein